jgi:site-specific DNA-cytosine methylase
MIDISNNTCYNYDCSNNIVQINEYDNDIVNVYSANHPTSRMILRNSIYATHRESYSLLIDVNINNV